MTDKPARRLDGRIALVTGAARGIGYQVALAFAQEGAHVIALARPRSTGALEELDDAIQAVGGSSTLVPLDLTDSQGIDNLGAAIYERWGRLDIMVANAGILGPMTPLSHVDPKDWAKVLDINLTANWRLIRSMEPLLRQSRAARAIMVTSGAAEKARAYWGPYAVSKIALEKLAETWAAETTDSPLKVHLLDPGATRTGMRAAAMPGEDPETLPHPRDLAPLFVELADAAAEDHPFRIKFRDWAGIN